MTKANVLSLNVTKLACNSDVGGRGISRLCAGALSSFLETEGDIKHWMGEIYVVDYCSKILEHERSM